MHPGLSNFVFRVRGIVKLIQSVLRYSALIRACCVACPLPGFARCCVGVAGGTGEARFGRGAL